MSFGRPLLLTLLLAIPLAALAWLALERRRSRYAVRFTNLELLASVAERAPRWRSLVPPALVALALAAALIAVARPSVPATHRVENASVVLALDVSGSMYASDVKPSRLGAAQAAVRRFVAVLPARYRLGLVTFAAEPFVAAPLSHDRSLVLRALDAGVGFGRGTAIGDAVGRSVEMLEPTDAGGTPAPGAAAGDRPLNAILLLSDGAQRGGVLAPLQGAQRARSYHIPVYTVALGTPGGDAGGGGQGSGPPGLGGGGFGGGGFGGFNMAPDPETLRQIARVTGGKAFATADADRLKAVYEDLASHLGSVPGRRQIGDVLLAIAAALALGAAATSIRWVHRLP
ncbi:MAG TPA: VWA domain-containing protein [Solirubrobacteraceae bacterium]|nr:VWA domain-containing protein [Solirubrobacteraceae bacterium]